ncbi:MAG: TetR/AcrR family transcriptional regulator [Deltaproteobacteria bacterium]|nr:TetR/AcrR family transcriptional regulator [Deltaproteobacteria bacterium]
MTKGAGRGRYDRSRTTGERAVETREKLLDAATEVFAARGYTGTRVEDLVDHAAVSRRTLYEHFDSIDAILEEVYERAVRISFSTVLQKLMGVTDPIERVDVGIRAYYEIIRDNAAAARVVFEVYRTAGDAQAAKYELNTTRYASLMFEFLSMAFAAGRLERAPDETSVYALIKGLDAVAIRSLQRKEHASLPDIAPQMSRLIKSAFGARAAEPG